jgi:hypothetical protein
MTRVLKHPSVKYGILPRFMYIIIDATKIRHKDDKKKSNKNFRENR